jgi:hypothetical protein
LNEAKGEALFFGFGLAGVCGELTFILIGLPLGPYSG